MAAICGTVDRHTGVMAIKKLAAVRILGSHEITSRTDFVLFFSPKEPHKMPEAATKQDPGIRQH